MSTKAIIMQLRPKQMGTSRNDRLWKESNVKRIIYAFLKAKGDKRPKKEIMAEIEKIFDFDEP